MKALTWLFVCALVPPGAHASTILDFLSPKHPLQVVTVTEVTDAGKKWRPVSRQCPAYFVAVSGGYHDFGGLKAGERPVAPTEVTKNMYKVLAKQGYLPATRRHPPELALIWTWGTMNTETISYPSSIPGWRGVQVNSFAMMQFMGGEKLGMTLEHDPFPSLQLPAGLERRSNAVQAIYEAAQSDLYVATLVAYDYAAAAERHEKSILWRTRISTPSLGFWLPEALPSMLAIAGPFFGRETPKPVWIDAGDKYRPDITLEDPKVLEYIDDAEAPRESPSK